MPFQPGDKLGPYEILAPLGAGGMGEVYRARDSKLNRDVAIKALPAPLANDTQYMARFEREAQMLAALNHPNIAGIYGIEQGAIVMELVEGADLKGPLPVEEAIATARQIAAGLEAAHEKGIIHRDLKPANIKLTPAGVVKILDFGLAKSAGESSFAASGSNPTMSPTLSMEMTRAGMILGTAAYMSPEQARGKVVDKRTDIWAFGVVLYELLSGKRLFDGDSVIDVMAAVVNKEPDWSLLPPGSPVELLGVCLQKDPKQRLRDIGDIAVLMSRPAAAPVIAATAAPSSRWPWAVSAVAIVAALILSVIAWRVTRTAGPMRAVQLQLVPPEGFSFANSGDWAQISPDGTMLILSNREGLWRRSLESGLTKLVPGTEGARYPFWSPDSRNVAFFQDQKLKRIVADGGPALDICAASDPRGGTWSKDDIILFAPGMSTGLYRVPAGGGTPEIVLKPTPGEVIDVIRYPSFLPDGRRFLYNNTRGTSGTGSALESSVNLGSMDGTAPRRVLRTESSIAVYAPPAGHEDQGRLLFVVNRGTLVSQPFDLGALQFSGEMSPVAEGVNTVGNSGNSGFSVSTSGTLVYSRATRREAQMTFVDRLGKTSGTMGSPVVDPVAAISPDGKRVAYATAGALFLQQVAGGPPTQIAANPWRGAAWSSDGRIAFSRSGGVGTVLIIKHLDGAAHEEAFGVPAANTGVTDWSVDGKWMVYQAADNKTREDLWLLPLHGDRKPVVFLQTPADECCGRFSPDGKWMAFTQAESVRREVFIQAISPAGAAAGIKYRISAAGGDSARWRRDGKELVYVSAENKMIAVPVKLGSMVEIGTPQKLFDLPPGTSFSDMTDDAQRFLINVPVRAAVPTNALTVVLNWQAGLKK